MLLAGGGEARAIHPPNKQRLITCPKYVRMDTSAVIYLEEKPEHRAEND